jgi:hypothetical protein
MAEITLQIKGLEKLTKLAERFPVVAEKHINTAINRSLVRIFAEEKKEAPFGVSGSLRDRWTLKVGRFQGFLRSDLPYAVGVHEGTPPHYVSAKALMPWAANKGLNPYAVAKSISKKGTRANPFFQRAIDNASPAVQKEFATALTNITIEVTKAI